MNVAVFGASGTIGEALLPLLRESHDVTAVSRQSQGPAAGIDWRRADVLDASSVRAALEGTEVAYYLVHSLQARDYEGRDRRAADVFAHEAERAGVNQIVYLGGLGDDSPDLSPHLRSRRETAARLAARSVPVTTLRSAIVLGKGSAAFETVRALVDRLPGMVCPRWVLTETQPIALADVTRYLAGVAGRPEALGRSYDLGGPEVMTYRDMIMRIARVRGRRPLIVQVPVLTPRLSSLWLHLVTPVEARVARPLIEGLRNPTVAHETSIRSLVPFPVTPFDRAVREALSA